MDILSFLDGKIADFCFTNKSYHAFRVGSTLFPNNLFYGDIDYLFVNTRSLENYCPQIDKFKKFFTTENYSKHSFETLDNNLFNFIRDLREELKSMYDKELICNLGFGPLKSENKDGLKIHVAGPMNLDSFNYFFSLFPTFYMVFSRHNKNISSKTFDKLFKQVLCEGKEIDEAINELIVRAKGSTSLSFKLQCIKKLNLITAVSNKSADPYLNASGYMNIQNLEEATQILESYE